MSQQEEMPKPISFGDDKKKGDNPRAIRGNTSVMASNVQQNAISTQAQQMSAKNQSMAQQTKDFGGKANEIVTLEIDEAGNKGKGDQKAQIYSIEVVQNEDAKVNEAEPEVYNDVSTFDVESNDISGTTDKLSSTLWSYSSEIDFQVNSDKNEIKNGVVFIKNYYCVYFKIYVHKENDNKLRIEFRRTSGDALASAQFLGDIKTKFLGIKTGDNDNDDDDKGGIDLTLNADNLELKINENADNKEMMMVHEALIADDKYVGDLEENAENYLYAKLVENKAIQKDIIDSKILCSTLMDKSMLLHQDTSIVRASLLILKKFIGVHDDILLNEKNSLFSLLNELINNQKYNLVKTYAVDLLAKLPQNEWKLNDELKQSLTSSIKGCQNAAKSSKNYDEKMFNTVYKKL